MIPKSDSLFSILNGEGLLTLRKVNKYRLRFNYFGSEYLFQRRDSLELTLYEMEKYHGIFKNDELNTIYEIFSKDDHLVLGNLKNEDINLTPIAVNKFSCLIWWMKNLIFLRDKEGEILGSEINNGRV